MGQRDPAREPATEPGGVARYRRAGACDEHHDSPGHGPGPSSGYRPPPETETQIVVLGAAPTWGEVEERAIMNVSVLVMF